MKSRAWALLLVVILAGCTRVIDTPRPKAEAPVAPITAGQVGELLSPEAIGGEGNLFSTVEPLECAGVAREVDPPFIDDHRPAATDGGHWTVEQPETYIEEMVGVFRADFDPRKALAHTRTGIESCRGKPFTVTTMRGREYEFQLQPPMESGSPDIVLWSFRAVDWACDSAFVAAHNAAVEISTCGPTGGYDVLSLARDASKRIAALANTTA
ncbi:sensor domain-containing protein [Mycobacterium deserti]|uniref:Sensor domain-containing protein n=1 Tax=Mycobacterium deserti TaxID=2978347 RepID=A0ABT2M794_9MYCO|nr:sensor domain-containing protein [Mycobacterium deserti]MCT7657806.1 sensor domain-containing protein [Mycobacterium deserti]